MHRAACDSIYTIKSKEESKIVGTEFVDSDFSIPETELKKSANDNPKPPKNFMERLNMSGSSESKTLNDLSKSRISSKEQGKQHSRLEESRSFEE